jgi:ADP-ribose pyrophosphatase
MSKSNQLFEEKTISTEHIFTGKIFKVEIDTVELPNGSISKRELVRHNGAVCVIAIVEDKLVLVEQYRKVIGRSMVEIPAGKLDTKQEDPESAARRELKEETGYIAGSMTKLFSFYSAIGFCDELIHLYVAEDLTLGEASLDEDEFLNVERFTKKEAHEAIANGSIQDAKTIMAVLAWDRFTATGSWS